MDHELPERDVYDPEVHGRLTRTPRPWRGEEEGRHQYADRPRVKVPCPYCPAETFMVFDGAEATAELVAREREILRSHIDEAHPGQPMP